MLRSASALGSSGPGHATVPIMCPGRRSRPEPTDTGSGYGEARLECPSFPSSAKLTLKSGRLAQPAMALRRNVVTATQPRCTPPPPSSALSPAFLFRQEPTASADRELAILRVVLQKALIL